MARIVLVGSRRRLSRYAHAGGPRQSRRPSGKPRENDRLREDHPGRPARPFLRPPRPGDWHARRLSVDPAHFRPYPAPHFANPGSEGRPELPEELSACVPFLRLIVIWAREARKEA